MRELSEAAKSALANAGASMNVKTDTQPKAERDVEYDLCVENQRLCEAIVTLAMLVGKER